MIRLTTILAIAITSASSASCVSPRNWSHDRHVETMNVCQMMCDTNGVKRYSPLLGTCECNSKARGN